MVQQTTQTNMQIFILKNGQREGPFSIEQIKSELLTGIRRPSDLAWYEGRPEWTEISKLLETLAPPPPPPPLVGRQPELPPTSSSEHLGMLLVFTPVVATLLCWGWIFNCPLMSAGANLGLLIAVTVSITGILAYFDASKLGFQKAKAGEKPGLENTEPMIWFFGFAVIWFVALPLYLLYRSHRGGRNLFLAGVIVTAVFVVSAGTVDHFIHQAREGIEMNR